MNIEEWNKTFSCEYMQQPISFLTEEKLDKLKQHCEKTIQYGNGRILEEHQTTLELIIRYKELQQELEKEKEKNKELIKQHAIEITDVGGNSIKIDLDGKIHNIYKLKEE